MLNGKELGAAIAAAINAKIEKGSVRSKAEIARHFGIRPPSIHDWIKKGSISKDKLPELWRYFSDVAGPEHWGLKAWPETGAAESPERTHSPDRWPFSVSFDAYETLHPEKKRELDVRVSEFIAGATPASKIEHTGKKRA